MLKKIATLLLLLSGGVLLASYQYRPVGSAHTDTSYNTTLIGNTLRVNHNSEVTATLSYNQTGTQNSKIEFGAGLWDASSKTFTDLYSTALKDGVENTLADTLNQTLQFTSGDTLSFWISVDGGARIYSTPGINTGITRAKNFVVDGQLAIGFETVGTSVGGGLPQFGVIISTYGPGEAPAPSGQPLPGLLATLFFGIGSAGAVLRFRRR